MNSNEHEKSPLTEQSLGVFWSGEEVDGITAYGYWHQLPPMEPIFPRDLWPAGTEFKRAKLSGDGWIVILWDIAIRRWPSPEDWEDVLQRTLQRMCEAGARVAWCGIEGAFAEPPGLFDPARMSGGVYAAYTPGFGFLNTAHLREPFRTLSDNDLLTIRAEAEVQSTKTRTSPSRAEDG
jgi:hypothetical protein